MPHGNPFLAMELQALDHVALAVRDVAAAAKWYVEVLGFERQHEGRWNDVPVFVGKGASGIALFPSRTSAPNDRPRGGARVLHFAWRADCDNFVRARRELKERGIAFEFEDHQIAHSIYFHDPDGHQIEITTYLS